MMYLVAFLVVWFLVRFRINKGEWKGGYECPNSKLIDLLLDFLIYAFFGLVIGARLGEVLFYNFSYYVANPLSIISPFDPITHKFIGIYGMSYHGGLIGVIISTWIWSRKNRIDFFNWSNFIIPAIPAGYFFGRVGNFINNELYGRITERPWGMYFSGDPERRLCHPSQLYEAILEGMVLFFVFWPLKNKLFFRKYALSVYLLGYAFFRFVVEFWREPDGYVNVFSFTLTAGQALSLCMIPLALVIFIFQKRKNLL